MENNKLQFSKAELLHYKKLISNRFIENPRMSLVFNKEKKSFKKNVFNLVSYCFHVALRANGVYVSKNKKTIVLFYENKKLKKTFSDYCRYFKVLKGVPVANIKSILNNEKEIKKHQLKLDNYIYVWFIAQEEGYGKLDGLNEINQMLFKLSNTTKLPIIFETSDIRLIRFYKHVGFDVYKKLKSGSETIYFFADKKTLETYNM
ncbi:hypothetical protein H2O64_01645 [Kordia sp. YSTF-M3]|uniref:N-acetyltransferase domain-containing protein n=1 Tax=Kordia aestuariivivens TaxID=2759037 RepID=A0ABR7Q457_9FLAO|nr:hypothetical protein [Kordia aestuariivivens]MBC8753354.1 hypothetical protein [Kordia aestuariivivens]